MQKYFRFHTVGEVVVLVMLVAPCLALEAAKMPSTEALPINASAVETQVPKPEKPDQRPQLMPYVGAFGGSAVASTWEPATKEWWISGYQSAVAQVLIGVGVDWIGEFAPEIGHAFHRKKDKTPTPELIGNPR